MEKIIGKYPILTGKKLKEWKKEQIQIISCVFQIPKKILKNKYHKNE
ncbi:MAG: hypothetical protein WC827_03855 [Candidatus Paceibacterota bacterium]|jgi:hypothetical protein